MVNETILSGFDRWIVVESCFVITIALTAAGSQAIIASLIEKTDQ